MIYILLLLAVIDCAAAILLYRAHTKNLRLWLRAQAAEKTIRRAIQHARCGVACGDVEGWPAWRWKDQIAILEQDQ